MPTERRCHHLTLTAVPTRRRHPLAGGGHHPVQVHAVLERRLHDVLSAAVLAEGPAGGYCVGQRSVLRVE